MAKQWTDVHRPRTLDDLIGQPYARMELRKFVAAPYSAAFIFAGPPGCGKSSAAEALGHDLGVDPVANLITVPSGYLDSEGLDWLSGQLRFAPLGPPGSWRLIVVEEADTMTVKAEQKFLSLIDSGSLPSRTVLVFTTNRPEWFQDRNGGRLAERAELIRFAAPEDTAGPDVDELIRRVWQAETGSALDAPSIHDLGTITGESGNVSFRRVVAALQRIHRERTEAPAPFALAPRPSAPRTLLSQCGPFARKPDRENKPAPARTPDRVAPIPDRDVASSPSPEPLARVVETPAPVATAPDARPVVVRIQLDPTPDPYTAAQDYVRGCKTRPTVKSVAKRHGIAWATAARYVAEVFGPPPIRTAIYAKSRPRPAGPANQPPIPAPRFLIGPSGVRINPEFVPN